MEEAIDNELPNEPLHYPAVATVADELPPWRQVAPTGRSVQQMRELWRREMLNRRRLSNPLVRLTQKRQDGREGFQIWLRVTDFEAGGGGCGRLGSRRRALPGVRPGRGLAQMAGGGRACRLLCLSRAGGGAGLWGTAAFRRLYSAR